MRYFKITFLLLVIALAVSPVSYVCAENTQFDYLGDDSAFNATKQVGGFEVCAENSNLILSVNQSTGDFSVYQKETQNTFYSVPQDSGNSLYSNDSSKEMLKSALYITYGDGGTQLSTIGTFSQSVEKNQVEVANIKNGVSVLYKIGEEPKENLIPPAITKERMESIILSSISSEREQMRVLVYFQLYDINEAFDEDTEKEWVSLYPVIKKEPIYVFTGADESERNELNEIFHNSGYTKEMYKEDCELIPKESISEEAVIEDVSTPYFEIPITITLSEEGLEVSIVSKDINYDKESFDLNKIALLPYFGSADSDDGYIFIPDGSGAIIDFNNTSGESRQNITARVYGNDYALSQQNQSSNTEAFRLPVFGIKSGNSAIFAVITEGSAQAEITAQPSNATQQLNSVYSTAIIKNCDEFSYSDWGNQGKGVEVLNFETGEYTGNYTMLYSFLSGDNADYNGMAEEYRNYLIRNGDLKKKSEFESLPFYTDTYGVIKATNKVFGISFFKKNNVTLFDQAYEMLCELKAGGINNINLRYFGYANGGLDSTVLSKLSVESGLGGKSGLKKLLSNAETADANIYLDGNFVFVNTNKLFDGFTPNQNAIKMLDKRIGGIRSIDYATNMVDNETFAYALNASSTEKYVNRFVKEIEGLSKNTESGVSAATMGQYLNSDFSTKRCQSRETVMESYKEAFSKLSDGRQLMVDGGNAYSFKYADAILGIPMTSSRYTSETYDIPFMQMVLHGYISYSGEALNLSGNYQDELLTAISYGGGVHFLLNYQNTDLLKSTNYSDCFSSRFETWKDKASDAYKTVSSALNGVLNDTIDEYSVIGDVKITKYSSGTTVMVNMGDKDQTVNGTLIQSKNFAVVGETENEK